MEYFFANYSEISADYPGFGGYFCGIFPNNHQIYRERFLTLTKNIVN